MEMLKNGLSCNDVKQWICKDGINTEPYGYAPVEPTSLLEPGDICPWHVMKYMMMMNFKVISIN